MHVRTALAVLIIFALSLFVTAYAEEPVAGPWKIQFDAGLGVTQAAFSDNWIGGQAGSIIWVSNFHGKAECQISPPWFQGNELKLEFGQTHNQDKDTKKWAIPEKSADKIRYDGILKLTKGWLVDPYLAATFESQFYDASDPHWKRYVNPIMTTEATGAARTLVNVPDKTVLNTRIGFGLQQRFSAFTDPADSNHTLHETTNNGGFEWVSSLALGSAKAPFGFDSRLSLFQAVFHSKSGGIPDTVGQKENKDWQVVTADWDNTLRANITSVIQTTLSWELIYDKTVAKGGRFREALTLGVSYKFANFEVKK
jgi:hypothetical protein